MSGGVTEVSPCIEIPFVDGAEGACANTVTHKAHLVNNKDWEKMRPTMIMLRASDWSKIKLDWLKGCRMLVRDGKKCNVALKSVDDAITLLNDMIKTVRK